MSFSPYQSIKNHTHGQSIELIKKLALDHPDVEWVATEKVHGSNFCFICDKEGNVFCARRNDILDESESFYNWRDLRVKYKDSILELRNALSEMFSFDGEISIYGELYGGVYPHTDVEVSGVKAVQNGVYYRPDVDFYPFDILVEGHGFVSYDIMKELCTGKFLFADVLIRGTFDECFEYDVEFTSTIPSLLGLPLIDNNIAEGIVLKPVITVVEDETRIIIKKKHPNFEEVAYAPKPKKKRTNNAPTSIPEEAEQFTEIVERYISENRLRNVISKIGELEDSKSSRTKLTNLYKDDILSDFTDDNPEYTALPENLKKYVSIYVNKEAPRVIGINWDAIIAGTF